MIKELAYVNTKTGESMCQFMNEPVLVKNKLIQLDNNNIITIFDYLAKTSENIFLIRGKRQLNILTNLTGRKFHNLRLSRVRFLTFSPNLLWSAYANTFLCIKKS